MKIRQGFVTNSSSTSYTIVVKDDAPKGYFTLLDLLKIGLSRNNLEAIDEHGALYFTPSKIKQLNQESFKILDLQDYIRTAKGNIEWRTEVVDELKQEISKIKHILTQSEDIISVFADPKNIRYEKTALESAQASLNLKLKNKQRDIDNYLKEIEFDKKQLEILDEHKDEVGLTLFFADIDHYGGSAFETFIKNSNAVVLKKVMT